MRARRAMIDRCGWCMAIISAKQLAALVGVSESTISRETRADPPLPCMRIRGRILFDEEEAVKFLWAKSEKEWKDREEAARAKRSDSIRRGLEATRQRIRERHAAEAMKAAAKASAYGLQGRKKAEAQKAAEIEAALLADVCVEAFIALEVAGANDRAALELRPRLLDGQLPPEEAFQRPELRGVLEKFAGRLKESGGGGVPGKLRARIGRR